MPTLLYQIVICIKFFLNYISCVHYCLIIIILYIIFIHSSSRSGGKLGAGVLSVECGLSTLTFVPVAKTPGDAIDSSSVALYVFLVVVEVIDVMTAVGGVVVDVVDMSSGVLIPVINAAIGGAVLVVVEDVDVDCVVLVDVVDVVGDDDLGVHGVYTISA